MSKRGIWLVVGFVLAAGVAGGAGVFLARWQSGATPPRPAPPIANAPLPSKPIATAPLPTQPSSIPSPAPPGVSAPPPTQSSADAPRPAQPDASAPQRKFTYEELTGSLFRPAPNEPYRTPLVREMLLPATPNANSVWGAVGRDYRGHIWVGVSANADRMSAHLLEYDPGADTWRDRGGVVDQLKAARLHREGEGQIKIHSRIIPANDGWLYFASTDEEGEDPSGRIPRWGGHLWRIHPERYTWQHLLAVPEGLVAASGVGRYVYALGYWGHVLYQYDTATGEHKRVVVGSLGGHVSRNFLSDVRGHAYVPRLSAQPDGRIAAELAEYDDRLKLIAATPLEFYLDKGNPESNHGMVGLTYLPDGRMLFTTHIGHLYLIEPAKAGPATVTALGWLHPLGKAYTPSLFAIGGNTLVAGVTRQKVAFEWVVFDLLTRSSKAFPLDTKGLKDVLLYGSVNRDNAGRVYVGGWAAKDNAGRQRPLVLQIDPTR